MKKKTLTVRNGALHFEGTTLVARLEGGSVPIPWPFTQRCDAMRLCAVLHEIGNTRDDLYYPTTICLPDATPFGQLVTFGFNPSFDFIFIISFYVVTMICFPIWI